MNHITIPLIISTLAFLPGTLPGAPKFSPLKSAVATQRTQSFGQNNSQLQKSPSAISPAITRRPASKNRHYIPAVQGTRRAFTPHGTAFRPFGAPANAPSVRPPAVAGLKRKALPPIQDRIPRRPDSVEFPGNDSAAPDPFDRGQPDSPAGSHFDTSSPTDQLGEGVTTGRDFEDAQGAIHENASRDRTGGARLGWTSNDPGVRTPDQGQASDGATKDPTIVIKDPIVIHPSTPRSYGGNGPMTPGSLTFFEEADGDTTVVDVSAPDASGNVTVTVANNIGGEGPDSTTIYNDVTPEDLERARGAVGPLEQPNPEDDSAAPLLSFFEPDLRQGGKKTTPKDLVGQPAEDPSGTSSGSGDLRPNVGLEAVTNPGDSSYAASTPGSNNGPDIGGTLPDPEGTPVANQ